MQVGTYEEEVARLAAARDHDALLMDELRAGHQRVVLETKKDMLDLKAL